VRAGLVEGYPSGLKGGLAAALSPATSTSCGFADATGRVQFKRALQACLSGRGVTRFEMTRPLACRSLHSASVLARSTGVQLDRCEEAVVDRQGLRTRVMRRWAIPGGCENARALLAPPIAVCSWRRGDDR
jgi:hypothetical protein